VHIDGSARVQSVTREQNERYYDLIKSFGKRTGVPAVLNTSFNLKGEAIVNSPFDAIRTFYTSGLDSLFLDRYLVTKTAIQRVNG
jgi:carbamoyltransferase